MKIIMKQGYELTNEIKELIKCYQWASNSSVSGNTEIRTKLSELGVEYFGWDIEEINYNEIISDLEAVIRAFEKKEEFDNKDGEIAYLNKLIELNIEWLKKIINKIK